MRPHPKDDACLTPISKHLLLQNTLNLQPIVRIAATNDLLEREATEKLHPTTEKLQPAAQIAATSDGSYDGITLVLRWG